MPVGDALSHAGVEAWRFEQHLDEAVLIPAGCPHQVRNLVSCTKVAADFVSPEGLGVCLQQKQQLRAADLAFGLPLREPAPTREHAEKLQSSLILVRAALAAAAAEQQGCCPP